MGGQPLGGFDWELWTRGGRGGPGVYWAESGRGSDGRGRGRGRGSEEGSKGEGSREVWTGVYLPSELPEAYRETRGHGGGATGCTCLR